MPDWSDIERRYKAGETAYSIAKSLGGKPTAVGIRKRAKRLYWDGNPEDNESGNSDNLPVIQTNWLDLVGDYKPVGDKDNPKRRALVLQCLSEGMSLRAAAEYVGIHPDTLSNWREADSRFSDMAIQAQRQFHKRHLTSIDQASTKGDWQAAKFLLQTHPTTREDYASQDSGRGGINIQVNIGVPDPDPQTVVIDQ